MNDSRREKIQTSMLINRLTDQALGKIDLTALQIKAIEILLRKSAPDLAAVQNDVTLKGEVHLSISEVDAKVL